MTTIDLDLDRLRKASILVVGDAMLDTFVYGDVRRVSPEAPIPILQVREQKLMLGGAANVAANIAALEARATLIGVIGDDLAGKAVGDLLNKQSQHIVSELIIDNARPTTAKTRFIASTQQVLRTDSEQTAPISQEVGDAIVARAQRLIDEHDVIVLSDYAKGVLTDDVVGRLIALCRKHGKISIVDPKRRNLAVYRGASYIKPNTSELTVATGEDCATDAGAARGAQRVVEELGSAVLLTRSERGMSLFRLGAAATHVASTVREVFDVSGAGDTALAAFAAALAVGGDEEGALRIANAAAGVVVGKLGTAVVNLFELNAELSDRFIYDPSIRIVGIEKAAAIARVWRERGLSVGFTNGCFDILHSGHVALIEKAASHCDRLVVGINSDASVKRLKGPTRPVQTEASRLQVLSSLKHVDLVTLFEDDTPIDLITRIKPDVLFKGADYREDQVVGASIVKAFGGRVELIELVPDMSTTNAIKRAMGGSAGAA